MDERSNQKKTETLKYDDEYMVMHIYSKEHDKH